MKGFIPMMLFAGAVSIPMMTPVLLPMLRANRSSGRNLYIAVDGVDRGTCTNAAHPCASFAYVDHHAVPGDVVHVAPGTYNLTSSSCIVTDTPGVTWQSDVRGAATINGGGNCLYMWHNSGSSGNIKILGFQFTGVQVSSNLNSMGVLLEGCNGGFEVAYNTFRDFGTSSSTHNFGAALEVAPYGCGTGNYTGTTCKLHDNTFKNIAPGGSFLYNGYSIYAVCGNDHGSQPDAEIYNNLIYNEGSIGIHLWHAANHTHVYNNTIDHAHMGILVGIGDQGATSGAIFDVSNNIVTHCDYGIAAEDGGGYTLSASSTFDNNLVYGNSIDWSYDHNGSKRSILSSFQTAGNVTGNPLYVSPSAGNYIITAKSPAVAKGRHNRYTPMVDRVGVTRPNRPSIGAYEPQACLGLRRTTVTSSGQTFGPEVHPAGGRSCWGAFEAQYAHN